MPIRRMLKVLKVLLCLSATPVFAQVNMFRAFHYYDAAMKLDYDIFDALKKPLELKD